MKAFLTVLMMTMVVTPCVSQLGLKYVSNPPRNPPRTGGGGRRWGIPRRPRASLCPRLILSSISRLPGVSVAPSMGDAMSAITSEASSGALPGVSKGAIAGSNSSTGANATTGTNYTGRGLLGLNGCFFSGPLGNSVSHRPIAALFPLP